MRRDIETNADIDQIVRTFYQIVPIDPLIGVFFTEVVSLQMDEHLPKIISFWCSLLLKDHSYKENVMLKHIQLSEKKKLDKEHFDRWLSIWNKVIDTSFEGPLSELAKEKASQIALLMQHKISQKELF